MTDAFVWVCMCECLCVYVWTKNMTHYENIRAYIPINEPRVARRFCRLCMGVGLFVRVRLDDTIMTPLSPHSRTMGQPLHSNTHISISIYCTYYISSLWIHVMNTVCFLLFPYFNTRWRRRRCRRCRRHGGGWGGGFGAYASTSINQPSVSGQPWKQTLGAHWSISVGLLLSHECLLCYSFALWETEKQHSWNTIHKTQWKCISFDVCVGTLVGFSSKWKRI